MALNKEIELENGIIVNYHRIVSLNKITNHSNIIEVASYTSQEKRQEEQEQEETNQETGVATPTNIFINTAYIEKEYNEQEDIEDVYSYLKTTEMFSNAEDC
jgi:hypothetical protein